MPYILPSNAIIQTSDFSLSHSTNSPTKQPRNADSQNRRNKTPPAETASLTRDTPQDLSVSCAICEHFSRSSNRTHASILNTYLGRSRKSSGV
ncbi:hypothetical protein GWI33_001787 [Rhynchophorus ferrugineus]|uniref:Uncharacterized protein n=1 Tax=Rhynchophorus ferrugineus TaxID=354439 RepID=A0A834MJY0_RHYFE|nr:hypothetical protein GWI33_001787 [Rhynchophorus ferrugineus]